MAAVQVNPPETNEVETNKYPVHCELSEFKGNNCLAIKRGKFPTLSGGRNKWRSIFEQDTSGDSMVVEVVKFLHAQELSPLSKARLLQDVETFIGQFLTWKESLTV